VNLLCRFDNDEEKLRFIKNKKGKVAKMLNNESQIVFAFNTLWNASKEGNLDTVRRLV